MTDPGAPPTGRPLISIGLASAAALAYEILLLRLFAITQWHHTAYMIISLALLGYGASGTVLGWWGSRWTERLSRVFPVALLLAGVSMILCFLLAQRVAVHPEEMLWVPRQIARLIAVYLLLAVPFLCVATAVGLALMRYRPPAIYASDLLGAGAGGALVVLSLYALDPMQVLRLVACLAFLAAWVGARETGAGSRWLAWLPAVLAAVVVLAPGAWTSLEISPYKGLSQLLRIQGARVAHQRSSPLGLVTAVESPLVPLRHAPGLSLAARRELPPQVALFVDGDGMSVVTDATGGESSLDYLHQSTAALPYHLRPPGSVLILASGGGERLLRARLHRADEIVAVELDRRVVELVRDSYRELSGRLYESRGVDVVVGEVRGFAARERRRFDVVEHVMLGGPGGQQLGLHGLSESYLGTVAAMQSYQRLLTPGGFLAITGWVSTPARGTIKRVATVLEALRREGVVAPERRLAVVRSWQTSTILVKQGELTPAEISTIVAFCRERMFDVVFYPGMERSEANRFNRLATPELHDGVVALVGERREQFLERSKFHLSPATDDRPFVHQYFRWRTLPEILTLKGRGGLPLLEAGYLVLVVTLGQALVLSLLIIGLPAWLRSRGSRGASGAPGIGWARVVFYFAGLGMGFLLLEVAFLQKFMLFLHHPVLAAAIVLSGFLAFAGLGSALAGRLRFRVPRILARKAMAWIIVCGVLALVGVRFAALWLVGAPVAVRVGAAIVLIAPLAFAMGMPFPLGLEVLRRKAPEMVPWAWGVNGCASVISPVLAVLLAVHLGFSAVILIALAVYGATAAAFPRSPT